MNYLDIDAFFPLYDEKRHTHTCILFQDGSRQYAAPNIAKYIPQLFFEANLNLEATRSWSSSLLKAKFNMPILINEQLIFIPVKFCPQPYVPSPSYTFGYVSCNAIAFYSSHEIILKNGIRLQTYSPDTFIEKKLRQALLLSYAYLHKKSKLSCPH